MKAGIITGTRELSLVEVPDPTPRPDQAVVEIRACGICGSDIHAYVDGTETYSPTLCGHEWFGEVVEVGADATVGAGQSEGVRVGQLVMAGIAPGCGACPPCAAGRSQYCEPSFLHYLGWNDGASDNGGFASHIAVDANRLAVLPDHLDQSQGALVEPTAVALHAIRRSGMRAGDTVAVVGAGPIGQLVAMCARMSGAGRVVVVEPNDRRRQRCVDLAADAGFATGPEAAEAAGGATFDLVFDAAGVPATLDVAAALARRGGTVCMVGITRHPTTANTFVWASRELSIVTSMVFELDDAVAAGSLIGAGRIDSHQLHEATVTLDDLPATFAALADRELDALKVLVVQC